MSDKGTNQMQRQEWVGDAVLSMLVKMILVEDHPEDTVEALCGRVDAYINNGIISKFCKRMDWPFGCNGFERQLADLVETQNLPYAKILCRQLIKYAKSTKADEQFRQSMIHKTTHKGIPPLPCQCGSMNLRVWRKPAKVVCADCKREFQPEQNVKSAQMLITFWNQYRTAYRATEIEGRFAG